MMAVRQQTARLRGTLRCDEPMARHTTWRVGGPADRYYQPADIDDLAAFLGTLPADEPLYWVGLGSNLLVRDGGIRGTVIAPGGQLNGLRHLGDGRVYAEAGVACAKLARFCAREGLTGAEFLAGIPGTLGGALAMNAGCFGGETWELVTEVVTLDRTGTRRERVPGDYEVGYRRVHGPRDEWFVAAQLKLRGGDTAASTARVRELLDQRALSQPVGLPSAGSVFRNPPGDHAARLIEACGLKGTCVGKACVSEKHANFIINTGGATAEDIEALIGMVKAAVSRLQGVDLQPEVHIVGEQAPEGEGHG